MNASEAQSDEPGGANLLGRSRTNAVHTFAPRVLRGVLACSIAVFSTACFVFHKSPIITRSFVIAASADANDNAPTTVDAVMIYNATMLPTVLKMSAKQWFDQRDQLRNDFPGGFEMREWEVVPGAQVDVSKLPFKSGGVGLVLFANYPGPGDHRARIDAWAKPRILLHDRTFAVAGHP
jgi:type VI secretion system protein